ncbi:MAG: adenylyltransferase/cytidyltransferase family protein [Bacteroidales bacterium]|nr:adenylyltransferase/cytidyltransferase family protein [Bacteroidales bacterium]
MIIGYLPGTFDLFHIGHLNIILNARSQCDKLIVGVNTDEVCFQAKNKYPVIPFEERIKIVEAIKYVDSVVKQDTTDRFVSWEKNKFDVIFVGDDLKGTEKWNKFEVEFSKVGVKVIFFPYTKTTSSTLVRKVLNEIIK